MPHPIAVRPFVIRATESARTGGTAAERSNALATAIADLVLANRLAADSFGCRSVFAWAVDRLADAYSEMRDEAAAPAGPGLLWSPIQIADHARAIDEAVADATGIVEAMEAEAVVEDEGEADWWR